MIYSHLPKAIGSQHTACYKEDLLKKKPFFYSWFDCFFSMSSLFYLGRAAFLLVLILGHFLLFGLPSIQEYLEGAVTVEEVTEEAEALPPPAVTLCAYENNFIGWKNSTTFSPVYQTMCASATSGQDVEQCIEEKTYNWTETIPGGAFQGFSPGIPDRIDEDLMEESFWIDDISNAYNSHNESHDVMKVMMSQKS